MDQNAKSAMVYDANKKSTGTAYLLWFFFASFGVHRFYLGRTGSAIAMLVITLVSIPASFIFIGLFGLAAIGAWALVDAFLIPGIVREHNNALIHQLDTPRSAPTPAPVLV